MTENVTIRDPEAEDDRPTEDQPNQQRNQQPTLAAERAGQATPATPDAVTTADMAAAGDRTAAPAGQPDASQARQPSPGSVAERGRTDDRAGDRAGIEPATDASTATTEKGEARAATEAAASLFPADQASGYRSRWQEIQTGFVDEPKAAVQEADALVTEVMRQLARTFADERRQLEAQWSEGEEISTEDFRLALQRYRSFFDRLLSV